MIIFGQGAIRCHPFVLRKMRAAALDDPQQALAQFDDALWGHIGFAISNAARAAWLAATHARYTDVPVVGPVRRYYQHIQRYSAAFALVADASMLTLGGKLKEKVSARLGDMLSYLYIASAVLKRWEDDGRPAADLPLVHWACRKMLYDLQERLHSFLRNFPVPAVGGLLHALVFPLGRKYSAPSDWTGSNVAALLLADTPARAQLCAGISTRGARTAATMLRCSARRWRSRSRSSRSSSVCARRRRTASCRATSAPTSGPRRSRQTDRRGRPSLGGFREPMLCHEGLCPAYAHDEVAQNAGYTPTSEQRGYAIRVCVADTDEEAYEQGRHFFWQLGTSFGVAPRHWLQPPGYVSREAKASRREQIRVGAVNITPGGPPLSYEEAHATYQIVSGNPDTVIRKLQHIIDVVDPGYMIFWGREGLMSHEVAIRGIDLMTKEVIPAVARRPQGERLLDNPIFAPESS